MLLNLLYQNPLVIFVVIGKVENDLLVLFDKKVNDIFLHIMYRFLRGFFRFHNICRSIVTV